MGLGYAYADSISGLYAALVVLAALEYRDRIGQGQYIDLSEYEAVCTLMGPALLDAYLRDKDVLPHGNRSNDIPAAPYGCYKCSGLDRWCVIAVFNEEEWQNLCKVLGDPDCTKEEKFSTLWKRKENREELDELLTQWTSQQTPEQVVSLLQEAGVPVGVVQNAEDLARDPQLVARDFFIHLEHPILGSTISDRSPIRFEDDLTVGWKAGPILGEDNQYVFIELLGLTEGEFLSLIEKGIIG
jgi:crotonobetainyl-CoA:carnitine CoA-transferase CaiB-like acyl-CoA transferase